MPKANYIVAATHGFNGEFGEEIRLTRAARDGYAALGMNLEALRTNVGLMAALLELGAYEKALGAGRLVLDALDGEGDLDVAPTREQADLLTALVEQNRGGCYEYMGRYEDALDSYLAAEGKYRGLGHTEGLGEIHCNRSAILLLLGRGSEALAAQEAASAIFEEAGLTLRHAQALANMGGTHLRLANFASSLEALGRARRLFDALDALAEEHLLLRDTADAYLELNLYSEALAAYEKANAWLREAGIDHDRARTLWGMGSALIALSNFGEAERALRGAADKFAAAGNAPMLSGVLLEQASLIAARGDREAALGTARRALDLVSAKDRPVEQMYSNLRLSDLLLQENETDGAEAYLLDARRLADRLALPHLRYRLDERLGRLRRLQGRDEEARALLEAAVGEIERLRGTVTQETMRASFLRDKTAAYDDLLLLHLARGDAEGTRLAFEVAEKAKSRALADLLTGVVDGTPDADPAIQRRVKELQEDLNATYGRMLGVADEDGQVASPAGHLQGRAAELENEIGHLRLQAATASADPFAALGTPEEDVPAGPPPGETLLAYHIVGAEVLAFVVTEDNVRVGRHLASAGAVARLLRRLGSQWDRFRVGPEFIGRHAATLELSTRGLLGSLYASLVAPLEPLLPEAPGGPGASKLTIVPHGLLHRVPFHALFDGERYLLERFETSYAPSARLHALGRRQGRRDPGRALVVGVSDPLLPAVAREARAVCRHLPGAEVLIDERATVAAVEERSAGRGILHLACHGLFRSDNPMFSSLKLHDGWLTAADALGLDLTGALVTLSACESGRSEVFAGDELMGLTRAFLGAGASAMTVSLWVVQDDTTASLMEDYYERLRDGAGPARALRSAQLALKEEHPHPYHWAPFVLVGKR
ncbi:MAG: CHAT domain-containing protein [Rubrobacter sp.]